MKIGIQTLKDKDLAIIPMAGFGKRIGSPAAKELLLNPLSGKTFLETCVDLCEEYGLHPLIISRDNKDVLNQELEKLFVNKKISYFTIEESFEWTQTVYASKEYWQKKNLLILPDVDFSPKDIISKILESLEVYPFCVASFDVENISLWGAIQKDSGMFCEKPRQQDKGQAWGILGFNKESGIEFFEKYQQTSLDHQWISFKESIDYFLLDEFKDLTRKK